MRVWVIERENDREREVRLGLSHRISACVGERERMTELVRKGEMLKRKS